MRACVCECVCVCVCVRACVRAWRAHLFVCLLSCESKCVSVWLFVRLAGCDKVTPHLAEDPFVLKVRLAV